jgi:hypothetical protein
MNKTQASGSLSVDKTHSWKQVEETNSKAFDSQATTATSSSANKTNQSKSSDNNNCANNTQNNTMSGDKNYRDRLGQWPFESDCEIAGSMSGFDRLKNGRFNKVILFFFH